MTKFFLSATVVLALSAAAQSPAGNGAAATPIKEGKVVYEQTRKLTGMRFSGNLPPEVQAQMEQQMAKPRVDQYELLFTPTHSLYQYLPNAEAENSGDHSFSGGGAVVQVRTMGGAGDVSYVDFAKGTRVDQRELMDKNFVVTDTITRLQWRLTGETKTILQFAAQQAVATRVVQLPQTIMENGELKREMRTDTVKVVAWFTPTVPVPAGPNYAGQLPGLILELDVNNGQTVIRAIEFSPKLAASKIKEPGDGKKITAAEFTKEREKMMEEMRKNGGPGRVFRMQ